MSASPPFFRVAIEGTTADKRKIPRAWLEQMASSYDPSRYGARIFLEHKRGVIPDGPFKAYGDVLTLKTKEEANGKLALYAQLDPLPEMVELIKARQKVYSSIEVDPDFADTKSAYLVGLGITDSPASLGTEPLSFSVHLVPRDISMNPIVSEAVEMEPETVVSAHTATFSVSPVTADEEVKETPSVLSKVKSMLGFAQSTTHAAHKMQLEDLTHAIETLAAHAQTQNAQQHQLREDFETLKHALAHTPDAPPRPLATGAHAVHLTDC